MSNETLVGPFQTLLKKYIRDNTLLEIRLTTGDAICGRIQWKDKEAIHIKAKDESLITLMKTAIVSIKALQ